MSRARRSLAAAALVLGSLTPAPAAGEIVRLGALGDSLTDEYAEEPYGAYARSWTELLVELRGVAMGPTAAEAGVPGGSWGEPRRTGFEDNWARYGTTTEGALAAGAHLGLAEGVAERGVTHAVFLLGGNDVSPWSGVYDAIYGGGWGVPEIAAWLDQRVALERAALDELAPTGVAVVLASLLDFGVMPAVAASHPDPVGRERVAAALALWRDRLRALAASYGFVFLDFYRLNRELFGPHAAPRGTLVVAGVAIDLAASAGEGGTAAAWVGDGIHPQTVLQGVWANAIAAALDLHLAGCVPLLSEAEILAAAGIPGGGGDTLPGQIGLPVDYVERSPGGALRFFGSGVAAPTLDRVVIALDAPPRPVDVGATDFTLELWLRAPPGENGSAVPCSTAADAWIAGNILVDRDVFGPGDYGDYGLSLMDGRLAFGVHDGGAGATLCSDPAVDLADGLWHHVAVTRRRAAGGGRPAGELRLFVDGVESPASPLDGPDGDLSYRDDRAGAPWDPFLVLGAEKHDAGPEYPSFAGFLDGLRLSTLLRYAGPFTPARLPAPPDAATAALYGFDEGEGLVAYDHAGRVGGPADGELRPGGAGNGPLRVAATPLARPLFADAFECGDLTAWGRTSSP